MSDDQKKPSNPPKGPIVKTGPTRGQERSRNDDGSWRKKRSDSGQSRDKKSGGCFLTTAACNFRGLPDDCHELSVLRKFRDEKLMATRAGVSMVEHYYCIAPAIAQDLVHQDDLELVWKTIVECVRLIEAELDDLAVKAYSDMVFRLQRQFNATHA